MKVMVTGSTGFIGEVLVRQLLEEGYQVRALVRKTSLLDGLPKAEGLELVTGDVCDLGSLKAAMEGCSAVFHTAALVKMWAKRKEEFEEVNVKGLENVLEAAKATPSVERIVFTSTFYALGPTDGSVGNEDTVHSGKDYFSEYGRTKAVADTLAREAVAGGVPLTIVYPGVVYGPGRITEGNMIVKLVADHLQGQLPGLVGPGDELYCFAHVEDVARGHILALTAGTVGGRYLLTGADNKSLNDVFKVVAELTGAPPPKVHLPLWFAGLYARVLVGWARVSGAKPLLVPEAVRAFRHDWAYSSAKAEREIGYKPRDLLQGLTETVKWLEQEKGISYKKSAK